MLVALLFTAYINRPLQLSTIEPLPTPQGNVENNETVDESILDKLPDVNPDSFKNKGSLAFVYNNFLFTLDGSTGELKQLTESGKAHYPRWSHDGKYLAYIRVTDPETRQGALWIVERDGKRTFQVQGLPRPVGAGDFEWSPTEPILAVKGFGKDWSDYIWLVPVDGEPWQLMEAQNPIWFAWSPDGKQIAYNITVPSDNVEMQGDILYTVDIEGGEPVKRLDLSDTGTGIEMAKWWPDGKGLLYWTNFTHSSSMRADGLGLGSLGLEEPSPQNIATTLCYKEWLSFNPRGKLLMVKGRGRELWEEKKLALVDIKTGKIDYPKIPSGKVTLDPAFSPDGNSMTFVAAEETDDVEFYEDQEIWFESRGLWVADGNGDNVKHLTNAGENIYSPLWSKDGSCILYVKDKALWLIGADGENSRKIVEISHDDPWGFYGHVRFTDVFDWYQ